MQTAAAARARLAMTEIGALSAAKFENLVRW